MTTTETGLAGTLLERRYRVDSLLARGGMSSVYRGADTRLDRPVAIKIMDPRFADDRSFVQRFEREARSAAKLHHPNIVTVHDQGVDGDHVFLIMELVQGGTLRDLLDQRGRLDVPLALTITGQMLEALSAAHDAGLVHRDVKPENVLLGSAGTPPAGVVKVADFGLVRAVASSGATSSSVILGTVAYLSPEQVTSGMAGERGDVYSAGIVLYEMLTGQAPYTGDTAISVAYRHVNDDVPAPSALVPDLPPALDDLVLRVTRRDPEARPADAGAFLRQLRQVRASLGIPEVAIPVLPAKAQRGSGALPPGGVWGSHPQETQVPGDERTVPAFSPVGPTEPLSGPRGTRALHRAAPAAQPTTVTRAPSGSASAPQGRNARAILLRALIVLVVGGLIGTMVWWFAGGGKQIAEAVDVPTVAGMDAPSAEKALREKGFTVKVTQQPSNTVAAGTAIGTDPAGGGSAAPNSTITLLLSSGKPKVPDVVGGTTAEAESAIMAQQLKAVHNANADDYSTSVPKDHVISVSPQAGTPVAVGATVTYALSKGVPPNPVPNVVGRTRDQAFQILRQQGFEPFDAGTEFNRSVPAGSVTRTDPPANSQLDGSEGTRVGVYTSNAVEVPSVFGMNVEQAVDTLTAAGLQADGGGGGRKRDFGFVIDTDPSAGTLVQKGTKVKLKTFP
ncbi:MAG TPA: Stk1 family PASTA domain-containing Ser/Thr kinase [Amycolatopsis sp.]|uniref:Stk1 family PASTA domain-containing Ser/Thr kinase n=1 Tax=Amycolatopsis sp. TaxID=37632 RepID=UPI002B4A2A75|nr:Stk1 family PASTA domain-containing Ser/Thr kinase [Amycolatopsis sp.]HKS48735.1 Stk1 family PASTA domain-containing Ser/Thr kinase [Amycolatopsis sp.]